MKRFVSWRNDQEVARGNGQLSWLKQLVTFSSMYCPNWKSAKEPKNEAARN
jgi:hypothetical protein